MEKWDAGQAVVLPHSLKTVARAKLSLPRHSWLSTVDWPTAGATNGGTQDGGEDFSPLSFLVGVMAMGRRGKIRDWIGGGSGRSKEGRIGDARATGREAQCATTSPPSRAHNKGAWGNNVGNMP